MTGKYREIQTPFQKALTVIGLVLCVIFSFSLICNIVIIVKGTLYPEMPPSVFGKTPMVVLSGSMSGTEEGHIEAGDLIFIDEVEPEALKAGDVIAFMNGSIVVTHRIVEVATAEDGSIQWVTKGDANNAADTSPVSESQLVGIYTARLPKVGNVAIFMQTPIGMVLCIGIPMAAFLIYDILRRQRYVNKERARRQEMQAELKRLRALAMDAETTAKEK